MDRDSRHFRQWLKRMRERKRLLPDIPDPLPKVVEHPVVPPPRQAYVKPQGSWREVKGPTAAQRERYHERLYRSRTQRILHEPRPGDKVLTPWGVGTIAEKSPFPEGLWLTYESV